MATKTLTPLDPPRPAAAPRGVRPAPEDVRRARLAVWADGDGPPLVWDIEAELGELIEALFIRASDLSCVPPLALRELIENLVHADFTGAVVTVLDGGARVRVCDRGPGVADHARALEPGYTSSGARGDLIRGVGAGLPTAARLAAAAGGGLELDENLGGGLAVTIWVPPAADARDPAPVPETTRSLLALMLELEEADVPLLAAELGRPAAAVARELAELEHHGLARRASGGRRRLTDAGRDAVTGLF